jgi:hypothetical protein
MQFPLTFGIRRGPRETSSAAPAAAAPPAHLPTQQPAPQALEFARPAYVQRSGATSQPAATPLQPNASGSVRPHAQRTGAGLPRDAPKLATLGCAPSPASFSTGPQGPLLPPTAAWLDSVWSNALRATALGREDASQQLVQKQVNSTLVQDESLAEIGARFVTEFLVADGLMQAPAGNSDDEDGGDDAQTAAQLDATRAAIDADLGALKTEYETLGAQKNALKAKYKEEMRHFGALAEACHEEAELAAAQVRRLGERFAQAEATLAALQGKLVAHGVDSSQDLQVLCVAAAAATAAAAAAPAATSQPQAAARARSGSTSPSAAGAAEAAPETVGDNPLAEKLAAVGRLAKQALEMQAHVAELRREQAAAAHWASGHHQQRLSLAAQHATRVGHMTAVCADYDSSLALVYRHIHELGKIRNLTVRPVA